MPARHYNLGYSVNSGPWLPGNLDETPGPGKQLAIGGLGVGTYAVKLRMVPLTGDLTPIPSNEVILQVGVPGISEPVQTLAESVVTLADVVVRRDALLAAAGVEVSAADTQAMNEALVSASSVSAEVADNVGIQTPEPVVTDLTAEATITDVQVMLEQVQAAIAAAATVSDGASMSEAVTTAAEVVASVVGEYTPSTGGLVTDGLVLNLNATKGNGSTTPSGSTPTTWTDLSGNAQNMLLSKGGTAQTSSAEWINGAIDYCQFASAIDASHIHGRTPRSSFSEPAKITLELVLRFTTALSAFNTNYPSLVMKYQAYGDNRGYGLFFEDKATNTLMWRFWANGAWRQVTLDIASIATDTTNFHHILCGFDGRYGRLYLDGVESLNAGAPWVDLGEGANFDITHHTTCDFNLAGTWNGTTWGAHSHVQVSALRLYNRLLSPEEVANNYQNKYATQ